MRQRYAIIVKKESNEIKNMGWSNELMCTSAANCLQNKSHYSSFHLHTAVNTNSYQLEYIRTSFNKRREEGGLSWSLGLRAK